MRGEHGSIDVLAWSPTAQAVLVVEVKTLVADLQDLLATLDRKRRLAPSLARELGWKPMLIGTILVMPEETQARNAVETYRPIFDATYPSRARQIYRWLRRPERDLRGIWFLLNFTPGGAKRRPGGSMRVRPSRRPQKGSASRSDTRPPAPRPPNSRGSAGGPPIYHHPG